MAKNGYSKNCAGEICACELFIVYCFFSLNKQFFQDLINFLTMLGHWRHARQVVIEQSAVSQFF